ncbi:N-acetyltransferase [Pedobacter sp. GSP4]|uniref:N-acetyltransferase n=1 Tax=Pedobacter sp. GSP4 TaxID=3453716 RepID=UPI003EE857D1
MKNPIIFVRAATKEDARYADEIVSETLSSALVRGSGISKRSPASIIQKMNEGKAVIAVTDKGEWVGFSYFETWQNADFISNSGLIVAPKFRNSGVAKGIKNRIFSLSRRTYPNAKIFSITTGAAIMKMNTQLGFEPVPFSEITQDETFWDSCKSCVNYDILERKNRCNCLCTAMLFSPEHIDNLIAKAENTLRLQQNLNLKSI